MNLDHDKIRAIIRHFADYVLLNGCCSSSVGLWDGQAGIALALFESSRFLDDSFLEEEAFRLLQKALLYQGEDISFSHGWAGIGFVLAYLSRHRFVDADYDSLFEKQTNRICNHIENKLANQQYLLKDISLGFFMAFLVEECGKTDLLPLWQEFCTKIEAQILCALAAYNMKPNRNFRMSFPDLFVAYIELAHLGCCCQRSSIIESYGRISGKHSAIHSLYIDYMGGWDGDEKYRSDYEWQDLLPGLPLRHLINMLYLLSGDEHQKQNVYAWIQDNLVNPPLEMIEKGILSHLHPKMQLFGYGNGISRLLLLFCELAESDGTGRLKRMEVLFK